MKDYSKNTVEELKEELKTWKGNSHIASAISRELRKRESSKTISKPKQKEEEVVKKVKRKSLFKR